MAVPQLKHRTLGDSKTSGESSVNDPVTTATATGVGAGTVLAMIVSWDRNKSILWAILHGIFSWFYVIYFALTRNRQPAKALGGKAVETVPDQVREQTSPPTL